MISVLFSIPKIQDGRHIDILSMLSDLLKKRKYEVTISLLSVKCIFCLSPRSLAIIWITNILLYLIYQHKSHIVKCYVAPYNVIVPKKTGVYANSSILQLKKNILVPLHMS